MNDFDDIFSSNSSSVNNIPLSNDESSFSDIPFEDVKPIITDDNIIILDERINDIKPRNTNVSFKKPSIIFPIIAFVFVSILGMYLFVNNSKADTINLIRIEENRKVGYIDSEGTIVSRAKYPYGTDFYKGYAIVKNNNDLYGVINGKGIVEVPFGSYYYIGLFGNRYIASKITNDGLKQALLNPSLDELTSFKYDSISYAKNGMYLFVRDETMGILNKEGIEIYSFKVDEVDDRNIDIEISDVDDDLPLSERYAKVKVNNSSTIINLETGKEVYSYTLKDINVLNNNVFYIDSFEEDGNNTYIVINNSEVKLKTTNYKRVRVEDVSSDIAIATNDDMSITYINLLTQKIINENKNKDYYYGDGLLLEKAHDFNSNKDVYNIISAKKTLGTFTDCKPVNNIFSNDILSIELYKDKYNYIDKNGDLLNSKAYDVITEFNEYGYAIISNDNNYGVINKNGKEIIKTNYNYINFLDSDLFDLIKENYKKDLFLYQDEYGNIGFLDSDGKIAIKPKYNDIKYITTKYPFVIGISNEEKELINLSTGKKLLIDSDNYDDIEINSNYIIIKNNYYNYSGKLIYTNK